MGFTIAEVVNNQLYFLISELDLQVGHHDNTGSIIGYSVVNSLLHLPTSSKNFLKAGASLKGKQLTQSDVEAYKRREARAVCNSLRQSIDTVAQTSAEELLSTLSQQTDLLLVPLLSKSVPYIGQSILLDRIITSMSGQKDYDDILRRKGLVLFDNVKSRRAIRRPEDVTKEDYAALKRAFVETKLVNYQR